MKTPWFRCSLPSSLGILLAGGICFAPPRAEAAGAYEIQVYASQTMDPGATIVELHSNWAPKDAPNGPGDIQPTAHAFHETLEVTRGFNDWFETGFYVFTSARDGEGWDFAGTHIRPRAQVPSAWHWPVGLSLSAEVGYFQEEFSEASWDAEIRPIVDGRSGPLYLSFNPVLEKNIAVYGEGSLAWVFAPCAKLSLDVWRVVKPGIEYYGDLGAVDDFDSPNDQSHQIYPVLDFDVAPEWEINAGVGFGLTDGSVPLTVKLILGRRFGLPASDIPSFPPRGRS